jgi:putative ABC transport system substrate-binding protein
VDPALNRRAFLHGTLAALTAPWAAAAQPAGKKTRIGVLYPGTDNSIFRGNFAGFRNTLSAAGYVEARNLEFDVRLGDGRELAPLALEITRLRPHLILAVARPGVLAIHAATSSTPVVVLDLESDPVASGFVQTLPRPGGNLTGVFMDFPELAGKWLEILKAIVPGLSRVAVLWDPTTGPAQLEAARRAAQVLKLEVYPIEARAMADIEPAVRAVTRQQANGMIALTSPIFNTGRRTIIEHAARARVPTLVPFPGYANDGGLVSYGPDVMTMYAQAGVIAVKILSGTPPAQIPVERPTKFELAINVNTARALGLTVPPSLLARADHVIE